MCNYSKVLNTLKEKVEMCIGHYQTVHSPAPTENISQPPPLTPSTQNNAPLAQKTHTHLK